MEISREVKLLIEQYHFKAQKHLGQNFLVSASALNFIVSQIKPEKEKSYIEVGPGFAILTREVARFAKHIYAIEKDERFLPFYTENPIENVDFIIDDALKVDFDKFLASEIFGNIPYYISSELLMKIARSKLKRGILLLQDEFVDRIVAKPSTKEYGSLTCFVQFFFDVKFLKRFPPSFFFPRPDVYSSVVELQRIRAYDESYEEFLNFIHKAFNFRRKRLISNLKNFFNFDFTPIFKELSISENVRPEEISKELYFEIYKKWKEHKETLK